ncbi:MAG TPA: hypothetical protein DEW10_01740, partial [Bifidobacterium sp.]|nr:hypothetical protein [Bifidobacterium sp.]
AMEEPGPMTREKLDESMGAYVKMFKEPFFLIDGPSINVSDEELYRWLNWCIFYGKPRDEYPEANKD